MEVSGLVTSPKLGQKKKKALGFAHTSDIKLPEAVRNYKYEEPRRYFRPQRVEYKTVSLRAKCLSALISFTDLYLPLDS